MRVGFIGLGKMGGPIARRLLANGHDLVVYDVRPAAVRALVSSGATAARSPREVASSAAVICSSLPTPDAVRAITLGPEGICHGKRRKIFIDFSTTGAAFARELAADLRKHGITMLDAPVTGGVQGAAKGALSLILSGNKQAVKQVRPMLGCLGRIFYLGRTPGHAQSMKLINNVLSAAAIAVTSEAFVMGVKAGLDPDVMLQIINVSSGKNSATLDKFPQFVLTRRFDAGAEMSILEKDVRLCIKEAADLGVTMWVGRAVHQLWEHACRLGGAGRDITELVRYLEEWGGGVQVIGMKSAAPRPRRRRLAARHA